LLTEYFAFPQKFLYLRLSGLDRRTMVHASDRLEIFVYLSRSSGELERAVSAANFALGCTPAVNLFRQPVEQVSLDGSQAEWLLVPDSRRPKALEIYSVESVRVSYPDDPQPKAVPYFHRLRLSQDGGQDAEINWFASRRMAPPALGGTECRIMLRDRNFDPARPADGVLSIDALCCNRDLPSLLAFGGALQLWRVLDPNSAAAGAECLTMPTPTLRPQLRERSGWRLVSHLALNHLGVTGGPQAALALREMLRLHDLRDALETRLALEGIVSVTASPGVARVPGMRPGSFARGLDLSLVYEPQAWASGGLFLLSAVLERFFALQVSINGFVRTSTYLRGRNGAVATWPARSGSRVLL
jgi:type VI secretion system protein ImpG